MPLWIGGARDHLKIAGNHEPGLNLRLLCSEAHYLGRNRSYEGVPGTAARVAQRF